jgi:radical SAM enzyme (rSAM/lipoprotein system)
MPLNDFLRVLDSIEPKTDKLIVVITGGEPLLRKDLGLCGKEIRKRGVRWGLVTNGLLYDLQMHITLLNAGIGALTISLDGLENNHNWLRNSELSFSKVDAAIDLAVRSSRLNFDVVTCVNSRNINELPDIYNYLIRKQVKAWRLFGIIPVGRAKDNQELLLTGDQFLKLMEFISQRRLEKQMDIKFSCEGYLGSYELNVRDSFFFCRAGINIGSVLIDGSISACPNIDRSFSQGNIYKDSFPDVWESKYQIFRERAWTKTGRCKKCREFTYCQGNGFHNHLYNEPEVLVCHNEKILRASNQ